MRKHLLVIAVVGLVAAACGPSDPQADTTVPDSSSTSSTTSSTTTTTTQAPTTTTTTAPPTTTTAPPTTTSTTSSTTTTTMPSATIELTDEGVQAGAEWVHFGYDDDDAVAAFGAVLGAPTEDTGWIDPFGDYGVCHPPMMRAVEWGSLVTIYTNGDTDFWSGGVEHFYAYYYTNVADPADLRTTEDLGIGSSLGDLKAAYDPAKIVIDEAFFDPAVGFWSYDLQDWTGMSGYATGQSNAHVITSINGGRGCGE